MFPQANPAAVEAVGRISFFFVLALDFFPFFFPSVFRSVVSIVLRRSGLDPRDLVFSDEFELTRRAGESNTGASSWRDCGSEVCLAMDGTEWRPGIAAGLERSV
jgi:hypothetical protein